MAIYHLTAKTGTRANGQSAEAKAMYILRLGKYKNQDDKIIFGESGNMPSWAKDDQLEYWRAADIYERANGRLFKEVEFALPRELTFDQQVSLAREFAKSICRNDLPYTLAIHAGEGKNPHAHLEINERINDGMERGKDAWFKRYNKKNHAKGGAQKTDRLKPKSWLEKIREDWALIANRALERAGHDVRIDHRTLDAQGINDRVPQIHLGPNVSWMEAKGIRSDRGDIALIIDDTNKDMAELQQYKELIQHECEYYRKAEKLPKSSGVGGATRALDEGAGQRSRGAQSSNERDEARSESPGNIGGHAEGESLQGHEDRSRQPGGPGYAVSNGGQQAHVGSGGDSIHDAYASATDRVLYLAGATNTNSRGSRMASTKTGVKSDRTFQAVQRQLKIMGCTGYQIGIHDEDSGSMINRTWTASQVIENIPWLKRMNAQGNNIYVRPAADNHPFVLVDDLSSYDIEEMKKEGREPSIIVETSPENYQAWVKLDEPIDNDHRLAVSRIFVDEYQADIGSADGNHYGRLAGFTNAKSKHANQIGYQPWVLLRESVERVMTASREILTKASEMLRSIQRQQDKQPTISPNLPDRPTLEVYQSEMKGLVKRFGDDISKCDYIAAIKLCRLGHNEIDVAEAIHTASPNIDSRKRGHEWDYAERTARKAFEKVLKVEADDGGDIKFK